MTPLIASTAALVLAAQSAPSAPASDLPNLSLEQTTGLRCGVAFALVAQGQQAGEAAARTYPAMEPRGKEFFVRFMARLMEQDGLAREAITALVMRETQSLASGGPDALDAVMPACLQVLDMSGV